MTNTGSIKHAVYTAIDRSISHDEIVPIDWNETAIRLLKEECEDYVETNDNRGTRFWGANTDGEKWRVHVRKPTNHKIANAIAQDVGTKFEQSNEDASWATARAEILNARSTK